VNERICTIDGCGREIRARGMCVSHYYKQQRRDRSRPRKVRPVLDRLAASSVYVATDRSSEIGDCLVWTGYANRRGYGRITIHYRDMVVHRAAWIARHGEPPSETPWVLHRCDNPPCWRDDHLFLGTPADNFADMCAKGRFTNHETLKTHCKHGHPFDTANTRIGEGRRACRACERENGRRRAPARAAARAAARNVS